MWIRIYFSSQSVDLIFGVFETRERQRLDKGQSGAGFRASSFQSTQSANDLGFCRGLYPFKIACQQRPALLLKPFPFIHAENSTSKTGKATHLLTKNQSGIT